MITFLRAKIEEGLSRAWQSTLIRARLKEQHPRRESNELKDQFNNAGIFGGRKSFHYFVERTCFVYDGLSCC